MFEVKLADRFSSRRVRFDLNPRYRDVNDASSLWCSPLASLVDTRFNQLARVHALTSQIAYHQLPEPNQSTVIVLHHPTDVGAPRTVDAYRAHLRRGETVRALSLREFLHAAGGAAAGVMEARMVDELRDRYLDLDCSATAFAEASELRLGHSTAPAG